MRTFSRAWILGCLMLATTVAARPARGFNLTGEWMGTVACKTFDGTQRRLPSLGTTMRITQSGTQFGVRTEDSSSVKQYNGQAIEDVGQPLRMRAVLIECRSTTDLDNYSEVVHLIGNAGAKLSLRGKSILRNQSGDIGTCRWTFQRVSSTNPVVPGCP